ncbi:MAG: tRNA (guanosine(46)-N7)-methyltransferase TrmB [Pseudonocardiaceae bacterium]|nr:tRNA (guanosine(46)-N7)-methyltransferase TrmB [Pseudonocardiaceae bacterium]
MPHIVSYAQRGERMTTGQQRAWDTRWPRLGRQVAELPEGPLDVERWFGRRAPIVLEVGSGMGESTAAVAAAHPELDHLAVEVYKPGLAQLLLRIEATGIDNLRLLRGDALDLLARHVAPGTLREVRAFFPDPWPKRRHHKRRLVAPGFVALVASRLEAGGAMHLATDWEGYAEQMLAVCEAEPGLRNVSAQGWLPRPDWRPVSKFEQRALDEGRVVRDLRFTRREPCGWQDRSA